MKKQIRLLVEGLFDDLYDIEDQKNLDTEISDNYIIYKFHPESFNDLRLLLKKLLKERGNDANLNDIDISRVDTFWNVNLKIGLFEELDPHNIDISQWNVSHVKSMACTFFRCRNFNCNLSKWDVSNVTNMNNMFRSCKKFTGEGLENWKVNKVLYMNSMFHECENFTGECLENWKVNKFLEARYTFAFSGVKKYPKWYKP